MASSQRSEARQLNIMCRKNSAVVMHSANHSNNKDFQLMLGQDMITDTNEVEDLGVIIRKDLIFTSHINCVLAKASVRANSIHKFFISQDSTTLLRACMVYVRPILANASRVWSPTCKTVLYCTESVQRKLTKRLPGLSFSVYRSRLDKLGIKSLEQRRLNYNLILKYKILFGFLHLKASAFFTSAQTAYRIWGHPYKLLHDHCRVNIHKHFFAEHVVQPWNSLFA